MVNYRLKALIIEVVDNQINENEPPCTKEVYKRLMDRGYSSLKAKEMIASIVAEEIYCIGKGEKKFDVETYSKKVYSLVDKNMELYDEDQDYSLLDDKYVEINNKTIIMDKKVYPNDPCPCGSGKKYKKCCGK